MFDYSLLHWTSFISVAVLLNLSPGPDIAFILGQTIRGGRKSGYAAMLGIWSGAFGHVIMAAAGLSAVLATSALAFSLVKWLGVAYLIWLGFRALFSTGDGFIAKSENAANDFGSIFRQGILIALLNPKVAIFFLAFLPQFVVVGAGPIWAQLFLHGILIIVVAALIEPLLVITGDRLTIALRNNQRVGQWIDRVLGTMFIALGIRLAFEKQE